MAFRTIAAAVLLASLPIAGCGTVGNLVQQRPGAGGVIPFGGVRHDLSCIKQAANGESACATHPESESEHYRQVAVRLFWAADLPVSFIGDVVTWPYTATYTFINQPIPLPPVLPAQQVLGPPVAKALPEGPGRMRLIAQSIALQGLVSLGAASPFAAQVAVALGIALSDAFARTEARPLTPPLETAPQPRYLP